MAAESFPDDEMSSVRIQRFMEVGAMSPDNTVSRVITPILDEGRMIGRMEILSEDNVIYSCHESVDLRNYVESFDRKGTTGQKVVLNVNDDHSSAFQRSRVTNLRGSAEVGDIENFRVCHSDLDVNNGEPAVV